LKKGLPVQNVSKVLGHSNPGMTLKRYAHVLDDMCQEAARAMDDLF
jgi:integrase